MILCTQCVAQRIFFVYPLCIPRAVVLGAHQNLGLPKFSPPENPPPSPAGLTMIRYIKSVNRASRGQTPLNRVPRASGETHNPERPSVNLGPRIALQNTQCPVSVDTMHVLICRNGSDDAVARVSGAKATLALVVYTFLCCWLTAQFCPLPARGRSLFGLSRALHRIPPADGHHSDAAGAAAHSAPATLDEELSLAVTGAQARPPRAQPTEPAPAPVSGPAERPLVATAAAAPPEAPGGRWPAVANPCVFMLYNRPVQGRCIPIEPINPTVPQGVNKWQIWQSRAERVPRLGRYVNLSLYPRRFYIDLGANDYNTSVADFKNTYPESHTFQIIAFEPISKYWGSYEGHTDVELMRKAAWMRNEVLKFALPGTFGGGLVSNKKLLVGKKACRALLCAPPVALCTSGPSAIPLATHHPPDVSPYVKPAAPHCLHQHPAVPNKTDPSQFPRPQWWAKCHLNSPSEPNSQNNVGACLERMALATIAQSRISLCRAST